MGRSKDVSLETKSAIMALLNTKEYSLREIAKKVQVSHQTVMRINNQTQGEGITKRQNCGRTRKTSIRTDRRIIQKACENRFQTRRRLQQELLEEGIDISSATLRRRLYEANLKSRRPAKKPKLTAKMRKARLEFAKAHQNYTVADWKKVIFILKE